MKQLFVTDMDGTLLDRSGKISPRSAAIISRLSSEGALITVATARTPATVEPLMAETLTIPPAIVMTGAALWDRSSRTYLHPQFIDPAAAETIIGLCCDFGIRPFSYTIHPSGIIHTYFHGHPTRREQKFIEERSRLTLKKIHVITRPVTDRPPVYPETLLIFGLGPLDKIYPLAEQLRKTAICSVSSYPDIFNHELAYIEIFAPGVDKASAVIRLKEHLGAERVTVFGDNLNDLPMMAVADTAVAVGNALPEVRQAADIVIDTHAPDAVARFLASRFPTTPPKDLQPS